MKTRISLLALLVALLAGCAAQPFVRPAPGELVLGRTHYAEVVSRIGEPAFSNDDVSINGEKVRTIDYYAYRFPKTSLHDSPHRFLHCTFYHDVLVGAEYNSSYQEDSTWFDPGKAYFITPGKSTRASVIATLGPPAGEILYPLVRDKNGSGLVYWYTLFYPRPDIPQIGYATEPSRLVVFLDANGMVTDLSYRGPDGKEHFPGHVGASPSKQQFPVSPLSY